MIYFEKVEVVNRLKRQYAWETVKNYTIHYDKTWIYGMWPHVAAPRVRLSSVIPRAPDKIHHEINQFCSKHTLQEVYIDLFHTVDDRWGGFLFSYGFFIFTVPCAALLSVIYHLASLMRS